MLTGRAISVVRGRVFGMVVAVVAALALVLSARPLGVESYSLEHIAILFVTAVTLAWGASAGIAGSVVVVVGDDLFLKPPFGRPTITGVRDAEDLLVFFTVALTTAWLVSRARTQQRRAEAAAALERQAREERDALLAAVSHDLKNPLAAIRGTVQFAQRLAPSDVAEFARLLARVDSAALRASTLVQMLNDLRGLDEDRLQLDRRPIDLSAVVRETTEMFAATSARHALRCLVPPEPAVVLGDEPRLRTVLENLIINAIKYSPGGGTIEVYLGVCAPEVIVTVRDHGIGVPVEARQRIFDRYFRAANAASAGSGLGLGLFLAREILLRHDNSIAVDAAPDGGSIFTLRVPAIDAVGTLTGSRPARGDTVSAPPPAQ